MAVFTRERKSLLSSQARIQAPWVKVTIGNFTFGVFSKHEKLEAKDQKRRDKHNSKDRKNK